MGLNGSADFCFRAISTWAQGHAGAGLPSTGVTALNLSDATRLHETEHVAATAEEYDPVAGRV